jgi:nitrite reductase/ring-hydroxylating ferredoxin subunit
VSRPERHPLPRDYWYVAAASAELGDQTLARTLFDLPVVLFRGKAGEAVALHDRCPHRAAPLSLGAVTEGEVACPYHGWRFGASGACTHIPSLLKGQKIARGVGVRALPCDEADGQVWVWIGDGPPDPMTPPAIEGFGQAAWMQGALDLACEAIAPIENNLDFCHPYFTHPGTHPQYFAIQAAGFREQHLDLATTGTGLVVSSAGVRLIFDLPSRVTVAPETPLGEARTIVLHHTPTTPGRCRQHWMIALGAPGAGPAGSVRWVDGPAEIFEQDRRVLEAAQRRYEQEGPDFERSVEADAPTLLVRRIIDAATAGRWADERPRLERRRQLVLRS